MKKITQCVSLERLFLFFLLFVVIYEMVLASLEVESWDLHRSYEWFDRDFESLSLMEVILLKLLTKGDFLFYTIYYLAMAHNIPYEVITSVVVVLYYIVVLDCIRFVCPNKIPFLMLFVILFTSPIFPTIQIARTTTAFLFLFHATKHLIKDQYYWAFIFCVAAIITHISAIMYVFVIVIAWMVRNKIIKSNIILIMMLSSIVLSIITPHLFLIILSRVIGGDDMYGGYSENSNSLLFATNIGLSDKISTIYTVIYSVYLLLMNKKQGFEFMTLLIMTIMLIFFINSNQMFAGRIMILFPMFLGLNFASVYKFANKRQIGVLTSMSIIGLLVFVYQIWGTRDVYLSILQ